MNIKLIKLFLLESKELKSGRYSLSVAYTFKENLIILP
jgi:hypothetical protein